MIRELLRQFLWKRYRTLDLNLDVSTLKSLLKVCDAIYIAKFWKAGKIVNFVHLLNSGAFPYLYQHHFADRTNAFHVKIIELQCDMKRNNAT